MSIDTKEFPEGLLPLGKEEFPFHCHAGVACFTNCCKRVDMMLYPYDLIRLKQALKIDSEKLIHDHVNLVKGNNIYFPTPMLRLTEEGHCPFLSSEGCDVYLDRPSACRTYPLERAVDRSSNRGHAKDYYFLTKHDYCLGHSEEKKFSVQQWVRNQRIDDFNVANDLWTEIDTIFMTNPWKGEGVGGPKQQLAFMICYNIDGFRRFADEKMLLEQFKIQKDFKRRIQSSDSELQKFGYEWLKLIFTGKSSLMPR